VNCYYSNLIEGHNTHPVDIERALDNDYSTEPRKRDLQLDAKAHVAVQRWIDVLRLFAVVEEARNHALPALASLTSPTH